MARIFISFYNAIGTDDPKVMPCFYETFIRGLLNSGNEVLVETTEIWNANTPECPSEIAKKIKDFNPDVCFLFNNCFYDISHLVDCPIVVYEVDSFLFYKNKEVLYKNPNRFCYVVPQTSSIDILKRELHVDKNRVCYVPFFTEVQATTTRMVNNICFVGSKFTNGDQQSVLHKFMLLNPNDEEKQQFKACLALIIKNPYVSIAELEQILGTLSPKVASIIVDPWIIGYISDTRRIKSLSSVASLGLDLYGTENWLNDLAYDDLLLSYKPQKIFSLDDTQKLYNSHKIGININHIQATTGFGWRVADIMASNSCLVSEYKPDFEILFPNIKIPFFTTPNEAFDVCKNVLENENMRLDIVAQCQEVINKKYRFKHTLQKLEDFLGISLCQETQQEKGEIDFLPPIVLRNRPSAIKIRTKQIIYSLGLFISFLPLIAVFGYKFRNKCKTKLDRYYKEKL